MCLDNRQVRSAGTHARVRFTPFDETKAKLPRMAWYFCVVVVAVAVTRLMAKIPVHVTGQAPVTLEKYRTYEYVYIVYTRYATAATPFYRTGIIPVIL